MAHTKPVVRAVFIVFCSIHFTHVDAQQGCEKNGVHSDSTLSSVVLTDGTRLLGWITQRDADKIRITTESMGNILIQANLIESIQMIDPSRLKKGAYWFENPNATRYLFAPSAFPLRKSEGYFQNTALTVNMCNLGLTDHFSMGGGFELISTFSGSPTVFVTPKVSGQIAHNLHLGAGALAGVSAIFNNGESDSRSSGFGIGYGILTVGNRENNISAGVGFGYAGGVMNKRPFLNISGMARISRKTGFVTENWFIPTGDRYDYGLSYGLRFMSDKITVDLAFINNAEIAKMIFIGIPYVDFVVKLGK